jgi:hypothetical protein
VHGLLDGARGKGLATPEWLVGVLGRAGISESLLELEESRVTVEQFNALFIAVKDSLNDECLGYLHGRPMRPGSFALMVRSAFTAHSLSFALRRLGESFALLQDDVALVPVTEGRLTGVALDMRGGPGAHADFLHAHLLRVFWRLLVWLHGGRLVPQRFDFNFAPPPRAELPTHLFRHVVLWAAAHGRLVRRRCLQTAGAARSGRAAVLPARHARQRGGAVPERAQRQRGSAWCCSGPVPNGLIWPSLRSACTCR